MTRFRQDEPYNEFYGSKEYRESWERMYPETDDEEEEDDDKEKENNESGRIPGEGEEADARRENKT